MQVGKVVLNEGHPVAHLVDKAAGPQDHEFIPKDYLNPMEAALYLRFSARTLEEWRRERKGPCFYKLGTSRRSRILYRRVDLDQWLTRYLISTEV